MSVSLWAYQPDRCDGNYCPEDCDLCGKADADEPIIIPEREGCAN